MFGPSPDEVRRTERRIVHRHRMRQASLDQHMAAEGIDVKLPPSPLEVVPQMMTVSLVAVVAEVLLKKLRNEEIDVEDLKRIVEEREQS